MESLLYVRSCFDCVRCLNSSDSYNSTRDLGEGEYYYCPPFTGKKTQLHNRDGLPGTLASEPSFIRLYCLLPQGLFSPRAQHPKALWVYAVWSLHFHQSISFVSWSMHVFSFPTRPWAPQGQIWGLFLASVSPGHSKKPIKWKQGSVAVFWIKPQYVRRWRDPLSEEWSRHPPWPVF